MFKNTFQSGFLSILYSIGSKPLQIWDKKGAHATPPPSLHAAATSPAPGKLRVEQQAPARAARTSPGPRLLRAAAPREAARRWLGPRSNSNAAAHAAQQAAARGAGAWARAGPGAWVRVRACRFDTRARELVADVWLCRACCSEEWSHQADH
jgi:hypothetical protein